MIDKLTRKLLQAIQKFTKANFILTIGPKTLYNYLSYMVKIKYLRLIDNHNTQERECFICYQSLPCFTPILEDSIQFPMAYQTNKAIKHLNH